jgi:hypothetical protein
MRFDRDMGSQLPKSWPESLRSERERLELEEARLQSLAEALMGLLTFFSFAVCC